MAKTMVAKTFQSDSVTV